MKALSGIGFTSRKRLMADDGLTTAEYAVGTVAGPAAIGAGMDLGGTNGFAWTLTSFFVVFVVFALYRLIFHPRRT